VHINQLVLEKICFLQITTWYSQGGHKKSSNRNGQLHSFHYFSFIGVAFWNLESFIEMFTQSAYVSFYLFFVHLYFVSLVQFLLYIHNFIFSKRLMVFSRISTLFFFLFALSFLFWNTRCLLSALEKVDDYEFKVLLDLILFFGYFVLSNCKFSWFFFRLYFFSFSLFLWKEDIIATTSVNTVTEEILDIF